MTNEGDSTSGGRKNEKFYIFFFIIIGFSITNMSNNNTYRFGKILGNIGKVEDMVLIGK